MENICSNLCPSKSNTDCFTGNIKSGIQRSSYGYHGYYLLQQNPEYSIFQRFDTFNLTNKVQSQFSKPHEGTEVKR